MTIREQSLHLLRRALQLQDENGSAVIAAHISHAIDLLEAEHGEGRSSARQSAGDGEADGSLQ